MNLETQALSYSLTAITALAASVSALTRDAMEMKERLDAQFMIIERLRNDLKAHARSHNEETA